MPEKSQNISSVCVGYGASDKLGEAPCHTEYEEDQKKLASINVENAAGIFLAADQYHASSLRDKCLAFIVNHFDSVTKTKCFEDMGRSNVDLVFEILRLR